MAWRPTGSARPPLVAIRNAALAAGAGLLWLAPGGSAATVCPNPPLPAVAGVCAVTTGDAGLLLRGALVVPGDELENGHLLIDASGTIVCASCDCSASPGFATATRVDCPDGVIAPGLIDGVEFLNYAQNLPADWGLERYEHRHDWRLGQNGHTSISAAGGASAAQQRWGELRQLMGGATSIRGSTGQAGLLRNLDTTIAQTEGLASPIWSDDNFPFDDSAGERLDGSCAYSALPTAPVDSPYWLTLAEGIDATARNEFVCASDADGSAGGADVIAGALINRGIALSASDVAEASAQGSTLVWSPRSNVSLYGRTAPITQLHRRGVPIALGTDWIVTGSSSMPRELACADLYNRRYLAGRLSDRELVDAATRVAAAAGEMDDEIGVLAPGREGDVAVFARGGLKEVPRGVIRAVATRVALVLRGGKPLLGEDAALQNWPVATCDDAPIDRCGDSIRLCLTGEIGQTYAQLETAAGAVYPAFQCDVPVNEPTCVPQRLAVSGGFPVHDGIPKATDFDGDGVANGSDLCPVIFDPPTIAPDAQADADGDLAGDACDFCPTSASATGCGEGAATDLVADLALPATVVQGVPFAATLVVTNAGAATATGRAVLPTLRELAEVSWTCAATGGGSCPASGTDGLDAAISLPPGAGATFGISAKHPGPGTAPGEHFVAVASAIPAATLGESDSLDNYDATATVVVALLFYDSFESEDTGAWSLTVPAP